MKKLLTCALGLIMVFAFAATVSAASAGFAGGTVVAIDKNSYDKFDGGEITANNSTTLFDNFCFIADNKNLNAWYINVTDDISGTLEVAYKVGGNYYVVTFTIDGPDKYWIADSKGGNGANMVKIGAFVKQTEPIIDPLPVFIGTGFYWQPMNHKTFYVGDAINYHGLDLEGDYADIDLPHTQFSNFWYYDVNGDVQYEYQLPLEEQLFDPAPGTILDQPGRIDVTVTYTGMVFSTNFDDYYDRFTNDPDFFINDPNFNPEDYTEIMEWLSEGKSLDDYVIYYIQQCFSYVNDEGYVTYKAGQVNVLEPTAPPQPETPNLIVSYEWKDLYGLDKEFADTKIIEFYPELGEHVLAVGTLIEDIRVIFAEEWYNDKGQRCYAELGYIKIDDAIYNNKLDIIDGSPPLSLTIEEGKQHTIDFLLAVAIEDEMVKPPTYFLEIYAPGSMWGEWTAYITNGGSMVFDQFYPDYYRVIVSEEEYGEALTPMVGFSLSEDGVFEFEENPWFNFEWDGDFTVTITFTLAE